jgi:hypothetical protein
MASAVDSDPDRFGYSIGAVEPGEIDENVATCRGDLTLTADDRMLLADFSTRVWASETVKKCPVVFAEPDSAADAIRIMEGRREVMSVVMEHGTKLWQDLGGKLTWPEG